MKWAFILAAFSTIAMSANAGADMRYIASKAEESCSTNSASYLAMTKSLLEYIGRIRTEVSNGKATKEQGTKAWQDILRDVDDADYKLEQALAKSLEGMREETKVFLSISQSAKKYARSKTVSALSDESHSENTIKSHFVQSCIEAVESITKDAIQREIQREATREKQLQELDDSMNSLDREIEAFDKRSAQRRLNSLVNKGANESEGGRMGQPAPKSCFYKSEFVSGLNKTCFYQCSTGVITTTVTPTEACTFNR